MSKLKSQELLRRYQSCPFTRSTHVGVMFHPHPGFVSSVLHFEKTRLGPTKKGQVPEDGKQRCQATDTQVTLREVSSNLVS